MIVTRRSVLGMAAAAPLLAAFQPSRAASALKALVIGINDYPAAPLERAVADATAVGARLEQIGYHVTRGLDLTGVELTHTIDRFADGITADNSIFLFLAGHGVQVAGNNFLLGKDAAGTTMSQLLARSADLSDLLEQVSRPSPSQLIAVFDACRSIPPSSRMENVEAASASATAPVGAFVIYSTGSGETALDSLTREDPSPNSVFTRALLPRLDGGASVEDVARRTKHEVAQSAGSVGHFQHPAIYDQSLRSYRLDGVATDPVPPAQAARPIIRPMRPTAFMAVTAPMPQSGFGAGMSFARSAATLSQACEENGVATSTLDLAAGGSALLDSLRGFGQFAPATVLLYFGGLTQQSGDDIRLAVNGARASTTNFRAGTVGLRDVLTALAPPGRPRKIILFLDAYRVSPGCQIGGVIERICPGGRVANAEVAIVPGTLKTTPQMPAVSQLATGIRNAVGQPQLTVGELALTVDRLTQDATGRLLSCGPLIIHPRCPPRRVALAAEAKAAESIRRQKGFITCGAPTYRPFSPNHIVAETLAGERLFV